MTKPLSAPDRLKLLLPWINGDEKAATVIRQQLLRFLRSFDGTAGAGFIQVVPHLGERELTEVKGEWRGKHVHVAPTLGEHELEQLRAGVVHVLQNGLPPPRAPGGGASPSVIRGRWQDLITVGGHLPPDERWQSVTLRFRVRRPEEVKLSTLSPSERRAYAAPGFFTMLLDGQVSDLLPLLVALHLMMTRHMVRLYRCEAPLPHDRSQRCGKFNVNSGLGAPARHCLGLTGAACRQRAFQERHPGYVPPGSKVLKGRRQSKAGRKPSRRREGEA